MAAPVWQQPKTDWSAADELRLEPDYARIRGNLLYLQAWAERVKQAVSLTEMQAYTIQDLPYAEFFNRVEQNLAAVVAAVYPRPHERRSFTAGSRVWDWRDLNRIEAALAQAFFDLGAMEQARPRLAFKLGGVPYVGI